MEDFNNNGGNTNNYNDGNAFNYNAGNTFNNPMDNNFNNDVNAFNNPAGNSFNNEWNTFNNPMNSGFNNGENAFNNNMGNNFNTANGNINDELAAFNSPNTNNTNNNNSSKGAKKILLIAIILLFIVIVVAGIIVFLHKDDSNQSVENQVDNSYEEDTTTDETTDSHAAITELSKLSKNSSISERIKEYNSLKTTQVTGTFEGLFNLNYEDIYKISVDTNDMLLFNSSEEDKATFYMANTDNTMSIISFELIYDKKSKFEEITSEDDEKGTIYEYNDWKYYLLDESAIIYYAFNRREEDDAILCLTVEDEFISEMSEESFKDLMEMIIDCIDIEHIGEYDADKLEDADSQEHACTNVLLFDDMSKIVISDKITLNFAPEYRIRRNSNMVGTDSTEYIHNLLSATRDGKTYSLTVEETKGKSIEKITQDLKEQNYTVESCDLNGTDAYIFYDEDGIFGKVLFEVEDIVYSIGYGVGAVSNMREFDRSTLQYENVLQLLGDGLFLAPEN